MRKTESIRLWKLLLRMGVGFLVGAVIGHFIFVEIHDNPKVKVQDRSKPVVATARENKTSKVDSGGQATGENQKLFQSKFGINFHYNTLLRPIEYDDANGKRIELGNVRIVFQRGGKTALKWAESISPTDYDIKPSVIGDGWELSMEGPSAVDDNMWCTTKHVFIKLTDGRVLWVSSSKDHRKSEKVGKHAFDDFKTITESIR